MSASNQFDESVTYSGTDVSIIRYWKDERYRNSLTKEQVDKLPKNPAGEVALPDEEITRIAKKGPGAERMPSWSVCYSVRTDITGCGGCSTG
jgi:mersacidin/lichenicidin family type 2 lantibiotic